MNDSDNKELSRYPWYEIGSWDKLQQGDILMDCPVLLPKGDIADKLFDANKDINLDIPIGIKSYDLVVMSQSCDLAEDKIDQVLLCAFFPASDFGKGQRISISKEHRPSQHMVEKCDLEGFTFEKQVVDFRTIYTHPKDFIYSFTKRLGDRPRLLPPYREHLSQAFARYFMRVGLPRPLSED